MRCVFVCVCVCLCVWVCVCARARVYIYIYICIYIYIYDYTGCPGRNVPDFGSMHLKLKYTDLTKNTYIQS